MQLFSLFLQAKKKGVQTTIEHAEMVASYPAVPTFFSSSYKRIKKAGTAGYEATETVSCTLRPGWLQIFLLLVSKVLHHLFQFCRLLRQKQHPMFKRAHPLSHAFQALEQAKLKVPLVLSFLIEKER